MLTCPSRARCHMPAPPMGTLSRACPPLHPCMCRSSPPPSHTHTCTNSHTHVCACTHAHTHICMHACTHTHARTHTCAHARTHARTHTLMHAQSYAHTCTHIHARTHTRTCTRTRTSCTSTIKSPIPTIPCRCPTEWPPRSATAAHRAHAATLSHTPALPMRMPSHALTHPHMPSHALTCPHSHALTCPHMPSLAVATWCRSTAAVRGTQSPSICVTCLHIRSAQYMITAAATYRRALLCCAVLLLCCLVILVSCLWGAAGQAVLSLCFLNWGVIRLCSHIYNIFIESQGVCH